jgi:hypothetical protein
MLFLLQHQKSTLFFEKRSFFHRVEGICWDRVKITGIRTDFQDGCLNRHDISATLTALHSSGNRHNLPAPRFSAYDTLKL